MLRSDLWDYTDAYIVLKWRITVVGTVDANEGTKNLIFKNNPSRHTTSRGRPLKVP